MTKKIAIFAHASAMEGAERSLITIVENLMDSGWDALVIVREKGPFTNRLEELKIPIEKLRYSWWETSNESVDPNWARLNYLAAQEASILICNFGASLVYTNTSVIAIGAMAASLSEIPHIYHIRELADGLIFKNHKRALQAIGKFIGNTTNSVVFNSRATLESWKPFLPEGTNSKIIYNPLFKPQLPPNSEILTGLNISVIGSITPLKSQLDVLRAVKILCEKGMEIQIFMIGPVRNDAYKAELDAYIAAEALESNVNFAGYQDNPYDLASTGQLVIVPGNAEGFGRVTAESMLLGIPVLAASGGATDELIRDGETGYLYEKGNASQLAEKIEFLISHPENLEEVVKNGQIHVKELTNPKKSISAILSLFEQTSSEINTFSPWIEMINPFRNTNEILPLIKASKLILTLKNRVLNRKNRQ